MEVYRIKVSQRRVTFSVIFIEVDVARRSTLLASLSIVALRINT